MRDKDEKGGRKLGWTPNRNWGEPPYPDEGEAEAPPSFKRPKAEDLVRRSYPRTPILHRMFGKEMLALAIVFGLVLMFAGAVSMAMAHTTTETKITTGMQPSGGAVSQNTTLGHSLSYRIGNTIFDIGAFFIAFPMLLIAVLSKEIEGIVRLGYLLFVAVLILCTTLLSASI